MSVKWKKFTDDGWAIWVDGDDTSTIYFHDWISPRGNNYIDVSVKIVGIKQTNNLYLYVPFQVEREEIQDISLHFKDEGIARAIFSSGCIIEYMKNEYTSEIAYNGKTVDVLHISKLEFGLEYLSAGTLIRMDYGQIQSYIDNDEGYVSFRLPHKSLDKVFNSYRSAGSFLQRVREVITSPLLSEKYGYSIRVNEARNLPFEINKIGAFHRQKLKKAVVTVSLKEAYEINDVNCYQIRRLEEDLYRDFVPKGFVCDDAITYQWKEERKGENLRGQFNFYLNISRQSISTVSVIIYLILLMIINVFSDFVFTFMQELFS